MSGDLTCSQSPDEFLDETGQAAARNIGEVIGQNMHRSRLTAIAFAAVAQLPSMTVVEPPQTADARVVLTADKREFFIGENALIDYCLENTTAVPFTVSIGGDYRGGTRSSRFTVTVTNAAGAVMPDPDPAAMNLGGLGGVPTVAGNTRWCESLPLARYATIDRAGEYVVRVVHDLGWTKTPPPQGEIRIAFAMPAPEQIAGVVAAMLALPERHHVFGQLSAPHQDFAALSHPMYLPELKRLAAGGTRAAVSGLAAIRTSEATRALIDLLSHPDRQLARDVVYRLWPRMPSESPWFVRRDASGNTPEDHAQAFRDATWKPEFAADIKVVMHAWLGSSDRLDIASACMLFRALGAAEDVPALAAALDRALVDTQNAPPRKPGELNHRAPVPILATAAQSLVSRGYVPPVSPRTPSERLMWLLAEPYRARPAGWAAVYRRLLDDTIPYIRIEALRLLPVNAPAELLTTIGRALRSADPDEQRMALVVVRHSRLREHAGYVASLARTSRDEMFLHDALDAIESAGGLLVALDIAADRLTDDGMFGVMHGRLLHALEPLSGGGTPTQPKMEEIRALSVRWKKFIADHRSALQAGKRFVLEDLAVTPDLLPAGWKLYRAAKPPWPGR